ncbi:hypothetical protein M409DRAFT_21605 [Zasmidium cellare ATCC 36951]|uniref:Cytochrome P450 n=1 Tax=Zasmidium cellare ATCC 36951 TaxID=1080233 RepID=A0A6A6CPV0_ZASCE|nr:uncharacterized protein M409DRAFT_21605 [Zasmidium cellare ATCC 36951]KAF2168160.1 hypothetical protein M409DRAFT_21605 [Zasmidium cellare ATCC 36951]
MAISPQTLALLASIVVIAGFLLYRSLLPKPIPGIPYNKDSARSLLGDAPDVGRHHAKTHEILSFLTQRLQEPNSPICQVWLRPSMRPWVVISDGREATDIMTRRSREFDRSNFFRDFFEALIPHHQSIMPTNDQWRYNRRLMADAMSSPFLNNVASHRVHESTSDLLSLLREKIRLAPNHVFNMYKDLQFCTMDVIWAATFGTELGISKSQAEHLSRLNQVELPSTPDSLVQFPENELPEVWYMLARMIGSCEVVMTSPLGRWHHLFMIKFYPSMRRALALRDKLSSSKLCEAWKTFADGDATKEGDKVRCVVDMIVERESILAKKQGREPDRKSKYLFDEMAGFLNAGYETTSTALAWGFKYLMVYQDVQEKLRDSLRSAHENAAAQGIQPSAEAIAKVHVPYLEAFMEESMRHSALVSVNIRVATMDTEVLGHRIPKGTDVWMLTNGPSYRSPALSIDENKRSQSSRDFKGDCDRWSKHDDLDQLRPERWLFQNEKGETEFDSRAAPMRIFGAGVRGCYGKKLAYLEMRVIYTLLVWNFHFDKIPDTLLDWKAQDIITHAPQNVRVKLRELKMS